MNKTQRQIVQLSIAAGASHRLRAALEIGVVVLLIMILITLASRNFELQMIRGQVTEAYGMVSSIRTDLAEYRASHGEWPTVDENVGNSALSQRMQFAKYVANVRLLQDGAYNFEYGGDSAQALDGKMLTFRPATSGRGTDATLLWACAAFRVPRSMAYHGSDATTVDPAFLPAICREF